MVILPMDSACVLLTLNCLCAMHGYSAHGFGLCVIKYAHAKFVFPGRGGGGGAAKKMAKGSTRPQSLIRKLKAYKPYTLNP